MARVTLLVGLQNGLEVDCPVNSREQAAGAWANVVDSGTLYTYSTAVPTPEAAEAIFERGGRSMMIGKKVTGNTMTSLNGAASGFTLPATLSALPVGIVVVIGN